MVRFSSKQNMKHSDSIIKISVALLNAQKQMGGAKKDAVNPYFHSKYADLGAVMEACKGILNENDITVLQPVGTDQFGQVYVETVLLHSSGEWISDQMRISVKEDNNPQAQGSAISYARRYGLQSIVFIPAEDDDANAATTPSKPKKPIVGHPSEPQVPSEKSLEVPQEPEQPSTTMQRIDIVALLSAKGKTKADLDKAVAARGKKLLKDLTAKEAEEMLLHLKNLPNKV